MFSLAFLRALKFGNFCRQAVYLAIALSSIAATVNVAQAQSFTQFGQYSRSYVTPFPEGDRYKLYVFGDSLGDGIWAGLYRAFRPDGNIDVVKKSKVSTGFVRVDYFDWNTRIRKISKAEKFHIAVIMVGANDMQPIRVKGKFHKMNTEGWRDVYGQRIDTFIKRLKETHAAVYWVGLPVMRADKHNVAMQVMNEVFREKAFVNGVKFIDTWNGFADQFGRYSAFGPDLSGQVRRLRANDGVHFTMKGYRKLAHFVEREIRRDMRSAKTERNIPLAGDEPEQARAVPRKGAEDKKERRIKKKLTPAKRGQEKRVKLDEKQKKTDADRASTPGKAAALSESAKSVAGVAVLRPEISDAAAAAAATTSAYAPDVETIASDIGGGLTALASVSPINDPTLSAPQRLPLTQRPYYRVLIKGEQIKPKAGRADDFSWPRG